MQLRWRLAVVTGAGGQLGREVSVRLGRLGAGVLAVDPDAAAAEETAELVRGSRVRAWSLQADVLLEADRALLAARAADLGGADLLVNAAGAWREVAELFVRGLATRRGRAGSPAERGVVVHLLPEAAALPVLDVDPAVVRVHALWPADVQGLSLAPSVIELLTHGEPSPG